jgi:hypothetical protein
MQFDLAALWQHVLARASAHAHTLVVAFGGTLALLLALGGVWAFWPVSDDIPTETVAVSGPIFTPTVMTAPVPAAKPGPESNEPPLSRYDAMRREDDRSLTRSVQRELTRAGCYDGPVNGTWNVSTRKGMAEFTALVNARLPVDHPDPILLVLLETHDKVSCAGGEPRVTPPSQKGETASIADERSGDARGAAAYDVPKAKTPKAMASAEPETETAEPVSVSSGAAVAAGGAAAVTAAAVAPGQKSAAEEPDGAEPKRTTRRYRQPSLSRQVSKGFKSIQRSLNKIFW